MTTVLILGATSLTAQAFIKLIQQDYPDVKLKLFVDNINNLPMEQQHKHQVIIGDPKNYNDYLRAIKDVDYVYNTYNVPHIKFLLDSIKETKTSIKHIVDISASEIHHAKPTKKSQNDLSLQQRNAQYSKEQLDKFALLKKSGIDFTILRPGVIKKGPETKVLTHVPDFKKVPIEKMKVNRPTLARTALDALFHGEYRDMSIAVSNGKALNN